ncbi:MAG: hypothetical protein E4H02_05160 [Lentisphaerales bacterium]|nr:MAG: hypothetical protein E4H02_05160 [Lentisphaerales bacterium]
MRGKDTFDVHLSLLAVAGDGAAVILGFLLATWLRFDSGWFPVVLGRPDQLYLMYGRGAAIAALLFLFVFKSLDLYVRPQVGSFGDKIPRLIRATGIGIFLTTIPAFLAKNVFSFSSGVLLISFFTVALVVLSNDSCSSESSRVCLRQCRPRTGFLFWESVPRRSG